MRRRLPHDRSPWTVLALALSPALALGIALGLSAPASSAPHAAGWTLEVEGEPVPEARADRLGGVLIADLAAVGPRVGLTVVTGGPGADEVVVEDARGHAWTSSNGASFFDSAATRVFLERPLQIHGRAILVPVDVIATLSGTFMTVTPDQRLVDLIRPTAGAGTTFTIPRPPEDLARMRAAAAADSLPAGRRVDARELAPPAHAKMRLRASAAYVVGEDAALTFGGDGLYHGVATRFHLATTVGEGGLDLQSGHLLVDDPELGWTLSAGDLPSRLWGGARGLRARYRIADGWSPTVTAYLPWRNSASEDLVVSWAEHLQLTTSTVLEAELASDTSLFSQLSSIGERWMVGAVFHRRPHRAGGMRHEGVLHARARVGADTTLTARAHAVDPGSPDGSIRAQASVAWPILPSLRATVRHESAMTTRSWSHLERLTLRLRAGAFTGHLAYRLGFRQAPVQGDPMLISHAATLGLGLRLGRHLTLDSQLDAEVRADGSLATAGRLYAAVRPLRGTTLELSAILPTGRLQVRLRQELPAGFTLGADYGAVTPFQPIQGATIDPHLVRVTLTRAWATPTPARGASVSGRLVDFAGAPVVGAVVQLERFRALTDHEGAFAFTPLPSGSYLLDVDPASLPASYAFAGPAHQVEITRATQSLYYDLMARRYGTVEGVVYVDHNRSWTFDPGEGLAGGPVQLGTRVAAPGPDGRFVFHNVPPGEHRVRLMVEHLADGYLPTDRVEVMVEVDELGESSHLATFPIARVTRPIRFQTLPSDVDDLPERLLDGLEERLHDRRGRQEAP